MAPKDNPTRKKKERNFVSPGTVGTRTGLRLPERPRDDVTGLEDPKGLFDTSPANTIRSTRSTRTVRKSNVAVDSSEDMVIQDSSAPDPTETLTERRAANAKGRLTPAGKSPIKTPGLGPARRGSSIGARSSPIRQPPIDVRASTQSPRKRLLDFSPDKATFTPSRSSLLNKSASRTYGSSSKPRSSIFDPIMSPGDNQLMAGVDDDDEDDVMGAADDVDDGIIPGTLQDSLLPMDDDMGDGPPVEDLASSQLIQEQESSSAAKKKVSRRPRSSDVSQSAHRIEADAQGGTDEPDTAVATKQGNNKAPTNKTTTTAQKKRGRPPKALAEKDGNIKTSKSKTTKTTDGFTKPGVPLSLQRQREQTPFDDGQLYTKSGRVSFKPLAFWKGERTIPVPHNRDEIQTIVRVDDVTPVKRKNRARSPAARPRKRRRREASVFEDDPDDEGEEPWELEEGVVSGPVNMWNNELGIHSEEAQEQELAFAARRIETREADGAHFLFAKTLTTPFFGSGIVELPPQGFKTLKNSRHFQMVFFVHYGKVVVEAATKKNGEATRFVITKGGMWQIPRGNFYSIANETDHPAKIFFAQGREMMSEPAGGLDLRQLGK